MPEDMPNPDIAPAEQTDVLSSEEQSQKIANRLADAQAKIANGTASDLDREIVAVFNTGAEAAEDMSIDGPDEKKLDPTTISDIVNVDDHGRGHVSDSISGPNDEDGRANNGQFLSNREMEVIAANADLIRNNMPPEDRLPIPHPPEDVPIPEPRPKPEPTPEELEFQSARVKNATQAVAEAGMHNAEEEKRQNSELGFFRRVARNMKFMTLFKTETLRRRGQEIFEGLRPEPPPLTREEFDVAVKGINAAGARQTDEAIIQIVNNPELRRGSDVVIEGSGEEDEHPGVARVRQELTGILMPYLQETSDPGMTPEEYQARTQAYQEQVRTMIDTVMDENPDFDREALSVMTDTSLELADRARVFLGHENSMQALQEQLRTMKISLGQIQIGPNAEYNTQYLERTLERMRGRAVDTMLARSSFSVGTFLLSGAMAHGLSEFSKQAASRSAAKYGGAVVGGMLFGPVGVGVGLAASTLAASMFARRLARNQARQTILHVGAEQGDRAATGKTELFERLSMNTLDFSDIERVYMESTEEQRLPDGSTERILRTDMSTEDKIAVVQVLGEARARFAIEDLSNPPVNLLSSQTPGSYLTERVSASRNLDSLEDLIRQDVGDREVQIPTGRVDENGNPITRSANVEDLLARAQEIAATNINADMVETTRLREQYVQSEGRRAAVIGGIASSVGGLSVFGISELISHGVPTSVFGVKSGSGETTQRVAESGANRVRETLSSHSGNVTANFNSVDGSKVDVLPNGKSVLVQTPTGRNMNIPLNENGTVSPKDLLFLKRHGVNLEQTTSTTTQTVSVPTDEAFSNLGGKPMTVNTWLDNGTPESNGTELGTHLGIGGQGQIIIEQNSGNAFNGGTSFDLNQMASQGKLNAYLTNNGQTVTIPMSVGPDGNMYAAIPTDSPLHSMFGQSDGRLAYLGSEWHIGVATDNPGQFDSVSTLLGPSSVSTVTEQVPLTTSNLNFEFIKPIITTPSGRETEYILGGLAPTPDGGILYNDQENNQLENGSNPTQPPTQPPTNRPNPPITRPTPSNGPSFIVGNTIVPSSDSPIPSVLLNSSSSSYVGNNVFNVGPNQNGRVTRIINDNSSSNTDDEEDKIFNNPKNRQWFDEILDNNESSEDDNKKSSEQSNQENNNQGNPNNSSNQDNRNNRTSTEQSANALAADDLVGATRQEIDRLQAEITTQRGWGEDVSDLERRLQGQKDMLDFLLDRDYLDENGNIVRVNNNQTDENSQFSQYEGIPLTRTGGLIDLWANAEINNDKTTASDIVDYLKLRMERNNLSDNLIERLIERLRSDVEKRKKLIQIVNS